MLYFPISDAAPYRSVVERQSCELQVLSSILPEGGQHPKYKVPPLSGSFLLYSANRIVVGTVRISMSHVISKKVRKESSGIIKFSTLCHAGLVFNSWILSEVYFVSADRF